MEYRKEQMMINNESPETTAPEVVPLTEEEIAQQAADEALAAKKKALADGIAAGKPIKIEVNCETGEEIVSLLTDEEVSAREAEVARNLAERLVTEAKAAQEEEERQALLKWIASQKSLPQAAKNALARAAGIDLTAESAT